MCACAAAFSQQYAAFASLEHAAASRRSFAITPLQSKELSKTGELIINSRMAQTCP